MSQNNNTERIIKCPHCQEFVIIQELNCKIFRHGTFRNNGEQIPPHSSKEDCDRFFQKNLIYGCGKPFRIVVLENENKIIWESEICEYI
jgi:hypothetical protein